MTNCNATLTTATVTDETLALAVLDHGHAAKRVLLADIPDGATVQRQGDRLVHVDLHTLTCGDSGERHSPNPNQHESHGATWDDLVPGATARTPPAVTDAELDAAVDIYQRNMRFPHSLDVDALKLVLEAHARKQGGQP